MTVERDPKNPIWSIDTLRVAQSEATERGEISPARAQEAIKAVLEYLSGWMPSGFDWDEVSDYIEMLRTVRLPKQRARGS